MRRTPMIAAALLTLSLVLTGCSGIDSSSSDKSLAQDAGQPADAKGGTGQGAADQVGAGAPGGKGKAADTTNPAGTQVIRTARLSVRVKNAEKAVEVARAAAGTAGGLVQSEVTESGGADDGVHSTVVLRVPQESYDAVLRELAGTGKLLSRSTNAKDVTDQVVDVNSRIASQRASVARVRELMDQAVKISDVVQLEGELSTRQAELESLLARQASLKDRASLATITLDLSEAPAKVAEEKKKDSEPGFLDALGGGWDALVTTVRLISVVLGAVLPFAAVFGALYVLWRLVRGRWVRDRRPAGAAAGAPEEQGADEQRGERD
ncbi:DUF4349 domain-containing protein [Streptomyces paludis]|uniref:DUF4349 domain-containing protein n=1 Tax=Streptomyces paludis TaxID=2282738 RepID=A0A345HW70_9ACTN|nr:DUF4349 domain-containing protein [Streptomyces paludis]AXG80944.1 DUF4349 domain-containing protein [Streptomyces paludis]